MNGIRLRLLGAGLVMLVMVVILSGWSALFAADGLLATTIQLGALLLGFAMIYRGENLTPTDHR
ncbi:hypothetical protein [Glutamicibacter mishrai]|uniref:hypothetical protein n=1 Tax=Glutamicibacter mishrai TaxID=1775880 RepID=UPI003F797A1D